MRFLTLLLIFLPYLSAASESTAGRLWADLAAKREALPGFHQEFEVSRTSKARRAILGLPSAASFLTPPKDSGGKLPFPVPATKSPSSMAELWYRWKKAATNTSRPNAKPRTTTRSRLPTGSTIPIGKRPPKSPASPAGLAARPTNASFWRRPSSPGRMGNSSKLLQGTVRALVDLETGLLISSRTLQA